MKMTWLLTDHRTVVLTKGESCTNGRRQQVHFQATDLNKRLIVKTLFGLLFILYLQTCFVNGLFHHNSAELTPRSEESEGKHAPYWTLEHLTKVTQRPYISRASGHWQRNTETEDMYLGTSIRSAYEQANHARVVEKGPYFATTILNDVEERIDVSLP